MADAWAGRRACCSPARPCSGLHPARRTPFAPPRSRPAPQLPAPTHPRPPTPRSRSRSQNRAPGQAPSRHPRRRADCAPCRARGGWRRRCWASGRPGTLVRSGRRRFVSARPGPGTTRAGGGSQTCAGGARTARAQSGGAKGDHRILHKSKANHLISLYRDGPPTAHPSTEACQTPVAATHARSLGPQPPAARAAAGHRRSRRPRAGRPRSG